MRRPWGPTVYTGKIDAVRIVNIGQMLRLIPWFISLLQGWSDFWLWLPLFSVVGITERVVPSSWIHSFGSSSEILYSVDVLLWSRRFDFFQNFDDLLILWYYSLGCYCTPKEVCFLYRKMQFGHAELKLFWDIGRLFVGFWSIVEEYWRLCQYHRYIMQIGRLWRLDRDILGWNSKRLIRNDWVFVPIFSMRMFCLRK